MQLLKVHEEIEVNADAERVMLEGEKGFLCTSPGMGVWAGRHIFYVRHFSEMGEETIYPLVTDEVNDITIALQRAGIDTVDILEAYEDKRTREGIDPLDWDNFFRRIAMIPIVNPEDDYYPELEKEKPEILGASVAPGIMDELNPEEKFMKVEQVALAGPEEAGPKTDDQPKESDGNAVENVSGAEGPIEV